MYSVLLAMLSSGVIHPETAIVGYDCGERSLNITTVSLLDVENCEIPQTTINSSKVYVNLLQMNNFHDVQVVQCKVQVTRTVYYCGMHSHNSIVENGYHEFLLEMTRERCMDMYRTGTFQYDSNSFNIIRDIKINQTTARPVTLAGSLNHGGSCEGGYYSDAYGTWEKVVVQGELKISLREYMATVNLNDNQIRLRSGVRCPLKDEQCIDTEGGYTYWTSMPRDICNFHRYGTLYNGLANKIIDEDGKVVYSLTTGDITFALITKGMNHVCGYELIGTEHPRLFIFETRKETPFAHAQGVTLSNLDIFVYTNSKFVFVERYIKTQINNLYRDVVTHRCRQEREILKNSLAIASMSPDQFAYNLMRGPGYMAVLAGEVIHIVKCLPVDVVIAGGNDCYAELKVLHNNETRFVTPKTHILKNRGTRVDCNALLPTYFYFNEDWHKFMPRAVETKAPAILKPFSTMTWKYRDIPTLATSGIYTSKDLEELLNRIMYPMEQPAVINDLAREIEGRPMGNTGGALVKLLDENAMKVIVENTWNRMWNKFMTFGTFSAGIIAILFIIQAIKKAIEVAINGIALHSIYGWSFHLLGAVWNSVTTFLIHLGSTIKTKETELESTTTSTAPESTRMQPCPSLRENEKGIPNNFALPTQRQAGYFSS